MQLKIIFCCIFLIFHIRSGYASSCTSETNDVKTKILSEVKTLNKLNKSLSYNDVFLTDKFTNLSITSIDNIINVYVLLCNEESHVCFKKNKTYYEFINKLNKVFRKKSFFPINLIFINNTNLRYNITNTTNKQPLVLRVFFSNNTTYKQKCVYFKSISSLKHVYSFTIYPSNDINSCIDQVYSLIKTEYLFFPENQELINCYSKNTECDNNLLLNLNRLIPAFNYFKPKSESLIFNPDSNSIEEEEDASWSEWIFIDKDSKIRYCKRQINQFSNCVGEFYKGNNNVVMNSDKIYFFNDTNLIHSFLLNDNMKNTLHGYMNIYLNKDSNRFGLVWKKKIYIKLQICIVDIPTLDCETVASYLNDTQKLLDQYIGISPILQIAQCNIRNCNFGNIINSKVSPNKYDASSPYNEYYNTELRFEAPNYDIDDQNQDNQGNENSYILGSTVGDINDKIHKTIIIYYHSKYMNFSKILAHEFGHYLNLRRLHAYDYDIIFDNKSIDNDNMFPIINEISNINRKTFFVNSISPQLYFSNLNFISFEKTQTTNTKHDLKLLFTDKFFNYYVCDTCSFTSVVMRFVDKKQTKLYISDIKKFTAENNDLCKPRAKLLVGTTIMDLYDNPFNLTNINLVTTGISEYNWCRLVCVYEKKFFQLGDKPNFVTDPYNPYNNQPITKICFQGLIFKINVLTDENNQLYVESLQGQSTIDDIQTGLIKTIN